MKKQRMLVFLLTALVLVVAVACGRALSSDFPQESQDVRETQGVQETQNTPGSKPSPTLPQESILLPEARPEEPISSVQPAQQILNEELEEAFSAGFKERLLKRFKITPILSDIKLVDDFTFTATLCLKNDSGKTYTAAIEGKCRYNSQNLSERFFDTNDETL